MSYHCSTCGRLHDGLPHIVMDKPDHYWYVPEGERAQRIKLTPDTCIIDNKDFFIRGVIEIPVHNYTENFGFGVWVSLKRENFYTYWENPDSGEIGPFFGWLCTGIAYYKEETLLLKTMAHFKGKGLRPSIKLEPTDHPLALDQHKGITLEKAWNIIHLYMNPRGKDA